MATEPQMQHGAKDAPSAFGAPLGKAPRGLGPAASHQTSEAPLAAPPAHGLGPSSHGNGAVQLLSHWADTPEQPSAVRKSDGIAETDRANQHRPQPANRAAGDSPAATDAAGAPAVTPGMTGAGQLDTGLAWPSFNTASAPGHGSHATQGAHEAAASTSAHASPGGSAAEGPSRAAGVTHQESGEKHDVVSSSGHAAPVTHADHEGGAPSLHDRTDTSLAEPTTHAHDGVATPASPGSNVTLVANNPALGGLFSTVAALVANIRGSSTAAAAQLAQRRDVVRGHVTQVVVAQRSAIVSAQVQKQQQIVALAESEKSAITAEQCTQQAGLDTQLAAEQVRMQVLFSQHAERLIGVGNQKSAAVRTLAEAYAVRVTAGGAQSAAQALQIGRAKASQYSGGKNADAIASMAVQAAQTTATQIREDMAKLAASLRSDGQQIAAQLQSAAQQAAAAVRGQLGQSRQQLQKSYAEARHNLVQHGQNARTQVDRNRDQAHIRLGQLATQLMSGLERIIPVLSQATEQVVASAQAALHRAGETHARTLTEVAQDAARQIPGPAGAFAMKQPPGARPNSGRSERITQILSEAAQVSVAQLGQGGTRIAEKLDAGAQAVAGSLAQLGAQAIATLGQVVSGLTQGMGQLRHRAAAGFANLTGEATAGGKQVTSAVEGKLGQASKDAEGKIERQAQDGKQHLTNNATDGGHTQSRYISSLTAQISTRAEELRSQSLLGRIWQGVKDTVVAIGGLLWGALRSIFNFVVGLVVLIAKLVGLLTLLAVAVVMLFVLIAAFLGAEIAAVVALIVLAVGAALIALYAVFEIIKGMILAVVGIVTKLYRAFTNDSLTLFQRATLVGEAVMDAVLLLLPFKAKIKGILRGTGESAGPRGGSIDPIGGEHPPVIEEAPVKKPSEQVPEEKTPEQKPPEKEKEPEQKPEQPVAQPIRTVAELEAQLSPEARTALEQQRELTSADNFQSMLDSIKKPDGTYDLAAANAFFEKRFMTPEGFQGKLDARTASYTKKAQTELSKIDNCIKETDGTNRPQATLGDKTSETALDWETENGEPYRSTEDHSGKIERYIKTIEDATAALNNAKRFISDSKLLHEIEQAILRGQERIQKMRPAVDRWQNRATTHPNVWNPNGSSKIQPGWPKPTNHANP